MCGEIGQHALRHHLGERHHGRHRENRRDERERDVAPRIERLAGRHRHDVVPAVDEDQQQRRGRHLVKRERRQRREARRLDEEDADDDEERQRHELADRQRVDEPCALTDAAHVDQREHRGHARQHQVARPARGQHWPVVPERDGDAGHDAGLARRTREPLHPADFERGEAAERRARVEIRSAGAFKAAADFGKTERY